jgi:tetratricopeptide (TPR) repeat protein
MGAAAWETSERALELCPSALEVGVAEAEAKCVDAIERTDVEREPELAVKLLEQLAFLYQGQGRNTEAIAVLRRSLDLAPELPHNATSTLARLLEQEGRLGEAKTLLEALIAERYAEGWSCLSFVDTFKLWAEGVYDAEKSPSLPAGAAA